MAGVAADGKQAVTIRQVLDHTAGVPAIPLDTTTTWPGWRTSRPEDLT